MQITNFVDSTSGFPTVNDNLYYISYFTTSAFGGTGPLQTNAGRQVSDAIEAFERVSGGTNIISGMEDIENAFTLGGVSSGASINSVFKFGGMNT